MQGGARSEGVCRAAWAAYAALLCRACLPISRRLRCPASRQVFLEDAGFDWKVLGPDVQDFDYVAWQVGKAWGSARACALAGQQVVSVQLCGCAQHTRPCCPLLLQCDQDAYACSGQKCSAQSILFMHNAWAEAGECRGKA